MLALALVNGNKCYSICHVYGIALSLPFQYNTELTVTNSTTFKQCQSHSRYHSAHTNSVSKQLEETHTQKHMSQVRLRMHRLCVSHTECHEQAEVA